jgi:hypothetical protein
MDAETPLRLASARTVKPMSSRRLRMAWAIRVNTLLSIEDKNSFLIFIVDNPVCTQ